MAASPRKRKPPKKGGTERKKSFPERIPRPFADERPESQFVRKNFGIILLVSRQWESRFRLIGVPLSEVESMALSKVYAYANKYDPSRGKESTYVSMLVKTQLSSQYARMKKKTERIQKGEKGYREERKRNEEAEGKKSDPLEILIAEEGNRGQSQWWKKVHQLVGERNPIDQQILWLRMMGKTSKEIGNELGMEPRIVKNRYESIRAFLRNKFKGKPRQ